MKSIDWSYSYKIEHLTIAKCYYSEYLVILRQLPDLRTFVMQDCVIINTDSTLTSYNMPTMHCLLRSLTITCSSLEKTGIEMILSVTPSLSQLKLISCGCAFDLIIDNSYWEKLISSKLCQLEKFDFFFSYQYDQSSGFVSLESLIIPFRTEFWLHEKRWSVSCAYALKLSEIWMYTTPIHTITNKELMRYENIIRRQYLSFDSRPIKYGSC